VAPRRRPDRSRHDQVVPSSPRTAVAIIWTALHAAVIAAALVVQVVLLASEAASPPGATRYIRFVSYFTVQSNVLVLLSLIGLLLRPTGPSGMLWRVIRLDGMLGIVITGLVYNTVLAGLEDLAGARQYVNLSLHAVSPLMAVIGWLVLGPGARFTTRVLAWAMIWPIAWLVYTFVHGGISRWYPYPFLDADRLGVGRAVVQSGVVAVIGVALGALLVLVDRRWPRRPLQPPDGRSSLESSGRPTVGA